jgi:caulimovirus viroplasmin
MAYYYAVKIGENPGIYGSWTECEKQVKGYPNAQFKKWKTREEAEAYINGNSTSTPHGSGVSSLGLGSKTPSFREEKGKAELFPAQDGSLTAIEELFQSTKTDCIAYVDGSFEKDSGVYGYGVVFIEKNGNIEEYIDSGREESYQSMRNVSGEILGALKATSLAVEKGYSSIAIFHDYQGIASWAKGEWKCNKEKTIEYREKMLSYQKQIKITFHKVLAHSGDYFNERADALAKQAVGINI